MHFWRQKHISIYVKNLIFEANYSEQGLDWSFQGKETGKIGVELGPDFNF